MNRPFIQILLVADCHWAVCSNIDTKDGGVMIVLAIMTVGGQHFKQQSQKDNMLFLQVQGQHLLFSHHEH